MLSNSIGIWLISQSLSRFASGSLLLPRQANNTIDACAASCSAGKATDTYGWISQRITATLTAATIVYVVDKNGATRTETKYNELPDGVTRPPTNALGTQTTKFTIETEYGKPSVVELAYPTPFIHYPVKYYWLGVLPTSDRFGNPVCSTATERQDVPYKSYKTPSQRQPASTDKADPEGYTYKLIADGCIGPAELLNNIDDAAPKLCTGASYCPAVALPTVKLLTETSTSFENENSEPTPTPDPTPQKPTLTKPTTKPTTKQQEPALTQPTNMESSPTTTATPKQDLPPLTIGTDTFAPNSQSQYVVADQTLKPGGAAVTIGSGSSKTAISLATNEAGHTIAVVNGQSSAFTATDIGGFIEAGLGETGTANPAQFTGRGTSLVTWGRHSIALPVLLSLVAIR